MFDVYFNCVYKLLKGEGVEYRVQGHSLNIQYACTKVSLCGTILYMMTLCNRIAKSEQAEGPQDKNEKLGSFELHGSQLQVIMITDLKRIYLSKNQKKH